MVPQRSCHCVVDVLREWVSMLLSSRECPGGRQRYGSGMQGRVCRKRQISQRLAASLEQHTLHNYDDSIRAITPHSLYREPTLLISGGFSENWSYGIASPCRVVAMLSLKRFNLGRGGQYESATSAAGPGNPRAK